MRFLIFVFLIPWIAGAAKTPVLYLPKKGRSVLFSWENRGQWKRYILSLSTDQKFAKNNTIEIEASEPSLERLIKMEGTYYWKVELKRKRGELVSPVKSFVLRKPPKLKAPQVESVGRHRFSTEAPKIIRWQSFKRAGGYQVEVYSWKTKKLYLRKKVNKAMHTFAELRDADEGYYFVRVAAVDKWGWVGRFSECRWTYVGDLKEIGEVPNWAGEDVCIDR